MPDPVRKATASAPDSIFHDEHHHDQQRQCDQRDAKNAAYARDIRQRQPMVRPDIARRGARKPFAAAVADIAHVLPLAFGAIVDQQAASPSPAFRGKYNRPVSQAQIYSGSIMRSL